MNLPEYEPKGNGAGVLEPILARSRERLARLDDRALELAVEGAPRPPSLESALRRVTVAVIAEVKRASPSLGPIRPAADPAVQAAAYVAGGAAAISVLTEPDRFLGSMDDLCAVVGAVGVPVLRKDFIVGRAQLLEARASGASAALLIVRALGRAALARLIADAASIGLDVLVEAHTDSEVDVAVDSGAMIIGVNARDLDTLAIDRDAAWAMLRRVPRGCIAVAESGMSSRADVAHAASHGAHAVLVGSALMAAADPAALLRTMAGVERARA